MREDYRQDASSRIVALSIVVAAYNEEPVILANMGRIVDAARAEFSGSWELVFVDDGSSDRTGSLMDGFVADHPEVRVIHHRRNFGQGRALRTGFDCCRGEIIVTMDADLSYGPEYISRMVAALRENAVEIILASPYVSGGCVKNVPLMRRILSRWGNRYLARMSSYDIATSTCVVRAYRREVLDAMFLTSDGMELQLEVLMKSAMLGFRVLEIPACLEWGNEKTAKSKRTSKMRILRTMQLYLQMGWLQRPAYGVFILSLFMLIPGIYMAVMKVPLICEAIHARLRLGDGLRWAFSNGLRETFNNNVYSFAISGGLVVVGIQLMILALVFIQNKYYFDDLYRAFQQIIGQKKAGTRDNRDEGRNS